MGLIGSAGSALPPSLRHVAMWVYIALTTTPMPTLPTWIHSNVGPHLPGLPAIPARLEFGPLVTPVSFRHPTQTARMAAAVDDLSGGRLTLGIGAGWQEREHTNYGWDLLEKKQRFNRFEEGLEVITRLLKSDHPVNFSGNYFHVHEAILLPRPQRPGGPPDPGRWKWQPTHITTRRPVC